MRMRWILVLVLAAAACGSTPLGRGPAEDGGTIAQDGGPDRGGSAGEDGGTDGGAADGGIADGGIADGGAFDGGAADGGMADGGALDGGAPDGGAPDGGVADGGAADGGAADGGSGADGGAPPDGGPRTCQEIAAAYAAALEAAKKCEHGAANQCQVKLDRILGCGCPTFVEESNAGEAQALAQQWNEMGCRAICPMIVCPVPRAGVCTQHNRCEDDYVGPGG
jgi:hypothetical protein